MNDTFQKIKKAIASILPGNQPFTLMSEPTGIGDSQVLRVITPAWKSLDKMERILRVQNAVSKVLSDTERSQIFRYSVLTDSEWKRAKAGRPESVGKVLARKRLHLSRA